MVVGISKYIGGDAALRRFEKRLSELDRRVKNLEMMALMALPKVSFEWDRQGPKWQPKFSGRFMNYTANLVCDKRTLRWDWSITQAGLVLACGYNSSTRGAKADASNNLKTLVQNLAFDT